MTASSTAQAAPRRWVLLGGLWLVYFAFGLISAGMAPLIRPIAADLGVGNTGMGLILGAWPLIYIASAIPCGIVLDRIATRWTMLAGSLFIGGSALARGIAGDEVSLFIAVALFGIGGPLISIGAPKLITQWFDGASRGTAIGIFMTGPSLGNAAALSLTNPVLMPLLGDDWRMVMFVEGLFALAAGLVWLALAFDQKSATGQGAAKGPQGVAAALAMLRDPGVAVVLAMGIGIFFINHGMNNWLPELLRTRGFSAAAAGYWASLPVVFGIAASLVIPRMAVRGRRITVISALFLAVVASSLLLLSPVAAGLPVALLLMGIARGSMIAVAMLILMDAPGVPRDRLGLAGGLFFVAAEIGGVSGAAVIGWLLDVTGGFAASLWGMAAMSAVLMALALVARRHIEKPAD